MKPVPQELFDLVMRHTAGLLTRQGAVDAARSRLWADGPQSDHRVFSLAFLQICRELMIELDRLADDAAAEARRSQATYAEIGVARGVSRQAARQAALRHQQRDAKTQAARRKEAQVDDETRRRCEEQIREDLEQRWPPRSYQYRAPAGHRTVTFVDGPAKDQAFRVPVGDDAFPFIDQYRVFGRLYERYARYTAKEPGVAQYRFTGEYFIRWR